ncbi:decarboxylating NADP(+)-dependent phosphogluconate dehydrogenase [Candidatus Uhrbacteria bacterium]|nr:decarboxylating NADP(+)-dependent phosphogluconate dehydrogenase [Candidatus Uhrbacteria bacterium]
MNHRADIGIIGLAVMGENLALNMESRGYTVVVYNRTAEKVDQFLKGRAVGKNIIGTKDINTFVRALSRPRKMMLMVKAGAPVDEMISTLSPLLQKGDIVIDGGNSDFRDTTRRQTELEKKGFFYVGTGVSGGEEGALNGPSIMPGGSAAAWPEVKPIFQRIAAQVGPKKNIPCAEWIGSGGAGHYVKMVHNAIEYADMQLICEAYACMKLLAMKPPEMAAVFADWNTRALESYLIEITAKILQKKDPEDRGYLVDQIRDAAGQKGTGKLASQNALDLGVPTPILDEAVHARFMSALKDERVSARNTIAKPSPRTKLSKKVFLHLVFDALYCSKIAAYAQGFALMSTASKEYGWSLDLGRIALLWRGGCIIRAQFLEEIARAYSQKKHFANLMLAPYFAGALHARHRNWRKLICEAQNARLAIPAFSSALSYYDAYHTAVLPANLLQAQRDFFGAHTYERLDKPGTFHTEWSS